MNRLLLSLALIAAFAGSADAVESPTPSPYDSRIKTVVYNAADVVRINTMVGVATHIQLEQGEHYVDHVFGNSDAWHFAENGNHIFIKPKAEHADANLVLITDRRVYNFELNYTAANKGGDKVFSLTFNYPDTQARVAAQVSERERVKEAFSRPRPVNPSYSMTGDKGIAPIHAWDDRRFTYMQFPGAVDIPQIFLVNPDGTESIINHHVEGAASDTVVLHKISKQWVLRLGKSALSVFNDAYDPVGESNDTRTASPDVIRAVKDGEL